MLSQRLYSFLGSWSTAYSSWVLVSMALERFLAVRFPLKVTLYNSCKARRVLTMLGVLGLVIALIYLPQLWTFQLVDDRILQCMVRDGTGGGEREGRWTQRWRERIGGRERGWMEKEGWGVEGKRDG